MEPPTAVLGSLVDLASRWGATVVAEGVETSEHFEIVRELGGYAAQGHLIGYPDDLPEGTVTDIRSVTTRMSLLRQQLGPNGRMAPLGRPPGHPNVDGGKLRYTPVDLHTVLTLPRAPLPRPSASGSPGIA